MIYLKKSYITTLKRQAGIIAFRLEAINTKKTRKPVAYYKTYRE